MASGSLRQPAVTPAGCRENPACSAAFCTVKKPRGFAELLTLAANAPIADRWPQRTRQHDTGTRYPSGPWICAVDLALAASRQIPKAEPDNDGAGAWAIGAVPVGETEAGRVSVAISRLLTEAIKLHLSELSEANRGSTQRDPWITALTPWGKAPHPRRFSFLRRQLLIAFRRSRYDSPQVAEQVVSEQSIIPWRNPRSGPIRFN
jgi:hypothetical protein